MTPSLTDCTSTDSEDSSLKTSTLLDIYEDNSLPGPHYENSSKCCETKSYDSRDAKRLPGLQCLKSQPPGGQYNTDKVSKSPTKVDMYESSSKWHKISLVPPDSIYKMVATNKEPKIESPSKLHELRIALSNSSPDTDTIVKVDPASKWHKFESIVMMSPLYKVIPANKWNKFCLAQPRSLSKTAPAYKELMFETSYQWHKVKTPSLCLKYPRLYYLRCKKSQPPAGHNLA